MLCFKSCIATIAGDIGNAQKAVIAHLDWATDEKSHLTILTISANPIHFRLFGDVPKWPKGRVCKTCSHQFESGRRLQLTAKSIVESTKSVEEMGFAVLH